MSFYRFLGSRNSFMTIYSKNGHDHLGVIIVVVIYQYGLNITAIDLL